MPHDGGSGKTCRWVSALRLASASTWSTAQACQSCRRIRSEPAVICSSSRRRLASAWSAHSLSAGRADADARRPCRWPGQPIPAVDAVSQPRVGWRFVLPYVAATIAMWMSFNAPGAGADRSAVDRARRGQQGAQPGDRPRRRCGDQPGRQPALRHAERPLPESARPTSTLPSGRGDRHLRRPGPARRRAGPRSSCWPGGAWSRPRSTATWRRSRRSFPIACPPPSAPPSVGSPACRRSWAP